MFKSNLSSYILLKIIRTVLLLMIIFSVKTVIAQSTRKDLERRYRNFIKHQLDSSLSKDGITKERTGNHLFSGKTLDGIDLVDTNFHSQKFESYTFLIKSCTLNNFIVNHKGIINQRSNFQIWESLIGKIKFFNGFRVYIGTNKFMNNSSISFQNTNITLNLNNSRFGESISINSEHSKIDFDSHENNGLKVNHLFLNSVRDTINYYNLKTSQGSTKIIIINPTMTNFANIQGTKDGHISLSLTNPKTLKNDSLLQTENNTWILEDIDELKLNSISKLTTIKVLGKKKLNLFFDKIDFDSLKIQFNDQMVINFDPSRKEDDKINTFESLLGKYKKENLYESYKFVDIQYKMFKCENRGLIGYLIGFISSLWWNFGYDKGRIVYITAIFLFIFLITNYINFKRLRVFYGVFDGLQGQEVIKNSTKLYYVTILTFYIFFSIKIDLDKIKLEMKGFTFYFFAQYIIGIICLFFLFNAILKI